MSRHIIALPPSDPIMRLRALVVLRDGGGLTEEEYQERFRAIDRQHGEWCACGGGQAVFIHPVTGARLCGACALEVAG